MAPFRVHDDDMVDILYSHISRRLIEDMACQPADHSSGNRADGDLNQHVLCSMLLRVAGAVTHGDLFEVA